MERCEKSERNILETQEIEKNSSDNSVDNKEYQLRVSEHLFKRLERQLIYLKHVEASSVSRQEWILNALDTKMKKEQGSRGLSSKKKIRTIQLSIPANLEERVDKFLKASKKISGTYTMKSLLTDAIEEQLEENTHKVEKLGLEIHG